MTIGIVPTTIGPSSDGAEPTANPDVTARVED
jgi:hypothetical protein